MVNQIVWREGLFLRPQHFQQNDRFIEYQLNRRTIDNSLNNFGFYDIEIDKQFLNSGTFLINRAHGIMPDGTFFDISITDFNLSINLEATDSGKIIYLVLPRAIGYVDLVTIDENKSKPTRMIAKRELEVPNINVGENTSVEFLVAQHNFFLLKEEDLNDGYLKIPVARIGNVSASNMISLDNDFMTTYIHIGSSSYLMAQAKEILSIIEFRIDKLSQKLSEISIQVAQLGDYLLLQLLNKFQSKLYFYTTQYKIHPQILHLELSTLASELSVFMKKEKKLNHRFFYDHLTQKNSFHELILEIKDMLSMVLEQNSIKLDVEQRKYGIYVAKIEDKSLIASGSFVFTVSADIVQDKLKKILLDNLKIGTIETIRDLVNYHLAGYKIKALPTPPQQIPYRVNNLYFQIEFKPEDKINLNKSGGLAFHLASEIENMTYDLWVIKDIEQRKRG